MQMEMGLQLTSLFLLRGRNLVEVRVFLGLVRSRVGAGTPTQALWRNHMGYWGLEFFWGGDCACGKQSRFLPFRDGVAPSKHRAGSVCLF